MSGEMNPLASFKKMVIFRELDFKKVLSYVKQYKSVPVFAFTYKGGVTSTGLWMEGNYTPDMKEFVKGLLEKFDYQFCYGWVNETIYKFCDVYSLIDPEKRQPGDKVKLLFQPTGRVKLTPLTEFKPEHFLFHCTSKENLKSIQDNGLIPMARDRGYKYPPLVHLLIKPYHMVSLSGNKLVGVSNWKTDLILFKVNPNNYKFMPDPAFEWGLITKDRILPEDIELISPKEYKYYFNYKNYDNTLLTKVRL